MKSYWKTKNLVRGAMVALCAVSLAAGVCVAQTTDAPPPPPPGQTDGPPPPPQQWHGRGHMGDPERRLEMMQKRLNLSDDQTAKIKSIFADGRSQMEALRANQSLAPEDRRAQARSLMQDEQAKINAVLTPDQQAKWQKMQERQREHMRDRRGPEGSGGPDGPPPPPDGSAPPPPPSAPPQL